MTYWIVNIAAACLLCVLCAGVIIPQILLIAYRKGLFDEPDERKIHRQAIPRLGGFAFKPVIFLSIALILGVNIVLGYDALALEFEGRITQLAFLFCSIMVLYLVGMADDLVGIRYKAKFVVQIMCGLFLILSGIWFSDLHGVFGIHALTPWVGYPLTVLFVVFIINAINLIDGVDGLASGLCSCALVTYGAVFLIQGRYAYSMVSFATLGVLIPFFYYNVFGNPEKFKKIFMGDTGSLTVGMILCFLSMEVSTGSGEGLRANPMVVAFSPLMIPCFDVLRVFWHRVRNHKPPFLPDKNHIHHKLLALGLGHRQVMMSILAVSIVFTLCNLLLSKVMGVTLLFILDLALWTLANVWLTKRIQRKRTSQTAKEN